MKKILLLPLLATMALVSQAWGAYEVCTGSNSGYCKWSLTGTGCDAIAIEPGAAWSKATCAEAYKNCKDNGYIYTNSTCTTWANEGNNPNFNDGVSIWCKWSTGCQSIKTDTELDNCKTNGSVFSDVPATGVGDGKACEGGTWTNQGKNPNATILGCCKWSSEDAGGKCYPIMSDETDATTKVANCQTGTNTFWNGSGTCPETCPTTTPTYPTSSSSTVTASSSSSEETSSSSSSEGNSSSSDGTDPIISYNPASIIGLNVVHFARNLQIASGKNATVSMYNIHGKLVLSQKILSGTTTISLASQRQGVYYVIAKSGSQKQIVKVILK